MKTPVPFTLQKAYYQEALSLNTKDEILTLFLEFKTKPVNTIILQTAHFNGKAAPLQQLRGAKTIYIATFNLNLKSKNDLIMSDKPEAEFGNTRPILTKNSPFKPEPNSCIISYKENDSLKHFKALNVYKKQ